MKIFLLISVSVMIAGCQSKPKNEAVVKAKEGLVYTLPEESVGTATAVIWVDKKEKRAHEKTRTKVVKAKANVSDQGKITIIDFVKNYPKEEQLYVKHKLLNFRVMIENEYIKPGVQFLQFRFIVNRVEEKTFLH